MTPIWFINWFIDPPITRNVIIFAATDYLLSSSANPWPTAVKIRSNLCIWSTKILSSVSNRTTYSLFTSEAKQHWFPWQVCAYMYQWYQFVTVRKQLPTPSQTDTAINQRSGWWEERENLTHGSLKSQPGLWRCREKWKSSSEQFLLLLQAIIGKLLDTNARESIF